MYLRKHGVKYYIFLEPPVILANDIRIKRKKWKIQIVIRVKKWNKGSKAKYN